MDFVCGENQEKAEQKAKNEFEAIYGKLFPYKVRLFDKMIKLKTKINYESAANNAEEAERILLKAYGYLDAFVDLGHINMDEFRKLRNYLKQIKEENPNERTKNL